MNTTFVNFQDNDRKKRELFPGCCSRARGSVPEAPSAVRNSSMPSLSYFPKIDSEFDNDNRGSVGYRTLSIHDLSGSVTGIPDSHIMLNDGENDSVVCGRQLCGSSHLERLCAQR